MGPLHTAYRSWLVYAAVGLLVATCASCWVEVVGIALPGGLSGLILGCVLASAATGLLVPAWREPLARRILAMSAAATVVLAVATLGLRYLQREPRPVDDSVLPPPIQRLVGLHKALDAPEEGDWLAKHWELGQTYDAFVVEWRRRKDATRTVLYIQPLGDFSPAQAQIVQVTAEFLGIYFQLPVRVCDRVGLTDLPDSAQRPREGTAQPQLLTGFVLFDILRPRLPDDAAALIACTPRDLTPGEDWNCVYGEAATEDRVAVWSLYRGGDPEEGATAYRLALLRSLKTAAHETGHLFGMWHCVFHECCMCGANHRAEADRYPLWLCPSCLAKLCHATGADPRQRFRELAAFAAAQGLRAEEAFWRKSLEAMQ